MLIARLKSYEYSGHPRLSVSVCVGPQHNSKTNHPKVFKLDGRNDLGISYKWYALGSEINGHRVKKLSSLSSACSPKGHSLCSWCRTTLRTIRGYRTVRPQSSTIRYVLDVAGRPHGVRQEGSDGMLSLTPHAVMVSMCRNVLNALEWSLWPPSSFLCHEPWWITFTRQ